MGSIPAQFHLALGRFVAKVSPASTPAVDFCFWLNPD